MSGKGFAVIVGCGLAILWMTQMDGKDAAAAIVFMLVGIIVALSVVSITGGTAASNAKRNAEEAKTLGARERALITRESNFNREIMRAAKPMAEQMFASWQMKLQAESAMTPQKAEPSFDSDFAWQESEL